MLTRGSMARISFWELVPKIFLRIPMFLVTFPCGGGQGIYPARTHRSCNQRQYSTLPSNKKVEIVNKTAPPGGERRLSVYGGGVVWYNGAQIEGGSPGE